MADSRWLIQRIWLAGMALMLAGCGGAGAQMSAALAAHTACDPVYYRTPVWSADGSQIYYAVGAGATPSFSMLSGGDSIHVMSRTGHDDRELIPWAISPSPSPDGRWLLSRRAHGIGGSESDARDYGLFDLAAGQDRSINPKGVVERYAQLGGTPVWSPDGKWLGFSTSGIPMVIRLDGASPEWISLEPWRTPDDPGWDGTPLWSPDGKRIVIESPRSGEPALYLMNADLAVTGSGSEVTRLTPGGACSAGQFGNVISLGWQPDGAALAYSQACGSTFKLKMITPDGIPVTGRAYLDRPVGVVEFSRDGGRIMLVEKDTVGLAVSVADLDGSGLRTIRRGALEDPHLSPDGKQIVFLTTDGAGLDEIYVMDADGTRVTPLTQNPGGGICLH